MSAACTAKHTLEKERHCTPHIYYVDTLLTNCQRSLSIVQKGCVEMILVTGFEGYAGRNDNPAARLAALLDGSMIAGQSVVGRLLPVDLAYITERVPALINEVNPDLILSIGLWPGETMIRLERLAVNHSHFEITDNTGVRANGPVRADGPDAYLTDLPLEKMQKGVRDEGIPCRISRSAGSFLCNALFYTLCDECARQTCVSAGFMHVPYLPEQVAKLLDALEDEEALEQHQRADYASMCLSDMEHAARVALACAAEANA